MTVTPATLAPVSITARPLRCRNCVADRDLRPVPRPPRPGIRPDPPAPRPRHDRGPGTLAVALPGMAAVRRGAGAVARYGVHAARRGAGIGPAAWRGARLGEERHGVPPLALVQE